MKPKLVFRILVDIGMTMCILMLMTYSLIGRKTHEYLGVTMITFFVMHNILNIPWYKNLFKGKYTPYRIGQTLLVLLMWLGIIGSAVCGVILSRYVFAALPIEGGRSWARTVHMFCGYWNFAIMSTHLGFNWSMIMGMGKKMFKKTSQTRIWILRGIALAIACYGVYAFQIRQLGEYMLLKTQFVFFDFDEPLVFFILDYLAIMELFVCIGHYGSLALKKMSKPKKGNE